MDVILEDTAEATMQDLQICLTKSFDHVEVRHSSRNTVMLRVCDALQDPNCRVKSMTFRSGVSVGDLALLKDALLVNRAVESLAFVCLKNIHEIRAAIGCCRTQPRIKRLSLSHYAPPTSRRTGEGRETIAGVLCEEVFSGVVNGQRERQDIRGVPHLEYLELNSYPIGSQGIQILEKDLACNTNIISLRLTNCDLRSDCASSIATVIRKNNHLRILDLSNNRLFIGEGIKQEMTLNTLERRGLKLNMRLLRLDLPVEPTFQSQRQLSKIESQLAANQLFSAYNDSQSIKDPFSIPKNIWPLVLARVSQKPPILNELLRESAVVLYR